MLLPLTAIVLVHRETPILWQSLRSLSWAEKIILIDNESQIPAERLYQAGVAEIFALPGTIDDFASVRNLSMKQVMTTWCFFLDSDEVVDPPTEASLSTVHNLMKDPATAGIIIKRSDIFFQKRLSYGEAGNRPLIRFVRPAVSRWVGRAHETPIVSGRTQTSELTISHYSHESIHSFIADVSRYAKIVAAERAPGNASNLVQLLFFPPLKLLYDLIVLGALLDGWRGIVYSYCMALHSLLVRVYWYEKNVDLVSKTDASGSI